MSCRTQCRCGRNTIPLSAAITPSRRQCPGARRGWIGSNDENEEKNASRRCQKGNPVPAMTATHVQTDGFPPQATQRQGRFVDERRDQRAENRELEWLNFFTNICASTRSSPSTGGIMSAPS